MYEHTEMDGYNAYRQMGDTENYSNPPPFLKFIYESSLYTQCGASTQDPEVEIHMQY